MQYNVKKWLMQASKEDLVEAATRHSISTGITNVYQLRRMLLDKFEWNNSHTDQMECARFLSTCIAKLSYPAEELTLGWVVTRDLEDTVKVGLNENFKWQGLDALVADVKKEQKERAQRALEAGRADRARNEERLGEALVEDATLAAPQVRTWPNGMPKRQQPVLRVECQPGGIYSDNFDVSHVVDSPKTVCRCGLINFPRVPGGKGCVTLNGKIGPETTAFTPVEPNPETLDDLSLEDLLGHYGSVEFRKKTQLSAATAAESLGRFEDAMTYATNAIKESKIADMVLEHIERRFEKQGWMISRIKDR